MKNEQYIKNLVEENASLKEQLNKEIEDKETTKHQLHNLQKQMNISTRNETGQNKETPMPKKTRIHLIADSNRKTITEPLRRMLHNCDIEESDQIYQTKHLREAIEKKTIPAADITVILIGTNDVRLKTQ